MYAIAVDLPSEGLCLRKSDTFAGVMQLQEICLRRNMPLQELRLRAKYAFTGAMRSSERCVRRIYAVAGDMLRKDHAL